jgi:hypothetical protein
MRRLAGVPNPVPYSELDPGGRNRVTAKVPRISESTFSGIDFEVSASMSNTDFYFNIGGGVARVILTGSRDDPSNGRRSHEQPVYDPAAVRFDAA